jgi:DNA-binding CsgD family transcriptional regulator
VQTAIDALRNQLLECLSLTELAGCAQALGKVVDASQTLVYQCTSATTLAFHGGTLAPAMPDYAPFYAEDPVHPYMRSMDNRFLLTQTDDWKGLELGPAYSAFYRPRDIHHLVGVRPTPFRYGQPGLFGFLFARSRGQGNVRAWQAKALAWLEGDLRAAWRRSQRTFDLRRDAALLAEVAVQQVQTEIVILLDDSGKLVWITPGAEQRWARQSSAALVRRLSFAARDMLSSACRSYPLPLHGELAGISVICDLVPWRGTPERPCCRVRLSVDVAGRIAKEFGLTAAQARTLLHLVEGNSNRAIATTLGVSENTVRSHVAQLRARTGLRSRAEILALYAERRAFGLES